MPNVVFDPSVARRGLEKLWSLVAGFGRERGAMDVFLNELVSDRYAVVRGFRMLRDELQLAGLQEPTGADIEACGADLSVPTVLTAVANTNCGDRIHQGETMSTYRQVVAGRFATLSETGELKLESFSPTGGGTDDGATLAHVTVAHQIDEPLRKVLYTGNAQSCVLVSFDLMTHVGRIDEGRSIAYGRTRESPWREPRTACGAIVGAIEGYNPENGVHRRLRRDLGEENFEVFLRRRAVTEDGVDITAVVAAAIVAVQGMRNVLSALTTELDERGVGVVTASVTVNRVGRPDTIIYLGRGTVFDGQLRTQGFGCSAQRYGGKMVDDDGDRRLQLHYDRGGESDHERHVVQTTAYTVRRSQPARPATARMPDPVAVVPPLGETHPTMRPPDLADLARPAPEPRRVEVPEMGRTLPEPRRIEVPDMGQTLPEPRRIELPASMNETLPIPRQVDLSDLGDGRTEPRPQKGDTIPLRRPPPLPDAETAPGP